jgi:hypothetical protein
MRERCAWECRRDPGMLEAPQWWKGACPHDQPFRATETYAKPPIALGLDCASISNGREVKSHSIRDLIQHDSAHDVTQYNERRFA